MKQLIRPVAVVLSSACVLIAAIGFLGTNSLAWFSQNRKTKIDTNELQIKAEGLLIDHYNVYKYDYDTGEVWNLTREPHVNAENPDHFEMTPYDSIFPERNVNTPLIFEVAVYHMSPGTESIDVFVDRMESVLKENNLPDFKDKEHRLTSNLICVKAATGETLGLPTDAYNNLTTKSYFDLITNAFKDRSSSRFIEINSDLDITSYTDRLSFDMQLSANEKAAVATDRNEKENAIYVYFIVDYDADLLKANQIDNFSDVNIFKNNQADYFNDLKSIVFEEKK